jgi:hypothetical protein
MIDDLPQWLRDQVDEDERIARAVGVPHQWHQGPGDDPEWTDAETVCMWPPEFHTPYERDKHWRGLSVQGTELAAHIALHDPARALREIEAKRAVVARYEFACREAGRLALAEEEREVWVQVAGALQSCVLCLAVIYADRPGYREEWRP